MTSLPVESAPTPADNEQMTQHQGLRHDDTGMTLIELTVVLGVVAVLATLAWPSFQQAIQKSRRSDAMAALAAISQAQERWRANNPSYQAALSKLPGASSPVSAADHYALTMAEGSTNGSSYTAVATAKSTSPQFSDGRCRVFRLMVEGGNIRYSSATSTNVVNSSPDPCWVK